MIDVERRLQAGREALGGPSLPGERGGSPLILETAPSGGAKTTGNGWPIAAGFARSPFGISLIAESPRGVCYLGFCEPGGETAAIAEISAEWPGAMVNRDDSVATRLAGAIFGPAHGVREAPPLRVFVQGSAFRIRVWRMLLRIPPGAVVSYSQLAEALGQPRAVRAVASAVAANSVCYLIPCHRVIRQSGETGEFRWGSARKEAMLAAES